MNNNSQNSIVTFITLSKAVTDIHGQIVSTEPVEVNPAFIVYMDRSTIGNTPVTVVHLAHTNNFLSILETPEQVSQFQMDLILKALNSLVGTMMQQMDEQFGGTDGFGLL